MYLVIVGLRVLCQLLLLRSRGEVTIGGCFRSPSEDHGILL